MDEIYELYEFLPLFPQEEQGYIDFLKSSLEKNYNAGSFQFAYIAAHMLFMCYVYYSIWKIKSVYNERFSYGIIGFPQYKDTNVNLQTFNSIFDLSTIAESTVFNVFKLIDMDGGDIGKLKKAVDKRNEIAHPTGSMPFETEDVFSDAILSLIENAKIVERNIEKVIREGYCRFLDEYRNAENWQYIDESDQINEEWVYKYKLSSKEWKLSTEVGISKYSDRTKFNFAVNEIETIKSLHKTNKEIYNAHIGADI